MPRRRYREEEDEYEDERPRRKGIPPVFVACAGGLLLFALLAAIAVVLASLPSPRQGGVSVQPQNAPPANTYPVQLDIESFYLRDGDGVRDARLVVNFVARNLDTGRRFEWFRLLDVTLTDEFGNNYACKEAEPTHYINAGNTRRSYLHFELPVPQAALLTLKLGSGAYGRPDGYEFKLSKPASGWPHRNR